MTEQTPLSLLLQVLRELLGTERLLGIDTRARRLRTVEIVSGIAALAAVTAAGAAIWQGFLTRDAVTAATWQARTMEDTEQRQLRAYIGPRDAGSLSGFATDTKTTATVYFKNFGLTPAYDLEGTLYAAVAPYAPGQTNVMVAAHNGSSTIIPSTSVLHPSQEISIQTLGFSLSVEQIASVEGGHNRIYVWGSANYKDAFNKEHRTRFCWDWGLEAIRTTKQIESCLPFDAD